MDQVLQLYRTLTQGERKMILSRLKQSGAKQHLSLYLKIENLSDIEQNDLTSSQLSILKNQLLNKMLSYLSEHKSNRSLDVELRAEMNKIEVLKTKFLFDLARKKIAGLKKKLQNHERYGLYIELLLLEFEIDSIALSSLEQNIAIENLISETKIISDRNNEFIQQKANFFNTLGQIHQQTGKFKVITPFYYDNSVSPENRSAHYYYQRRKLITEIQNSEFEKALKTADQLILLIDYHIHEFQHLPFQYIDINYMCGLAYLLCNKVDKAKECVAKIDAKVVESHPIIAQKSLNRKVYLAAIYLNHSRDKESYFIFKEEEIEELIEELEPIFSNRTSEQMSNYFLRKKELKLANKWNRRILNSSKKNQIPQFHFRSELRNLYIQNLSGRKKIFDQNLKRLISKKVIKKDLQLEEMRSIFDFWKI